MAKWYHLESPDKSERCCTQDNSAYEGWTELGTTSRPPKEDEEWDRKTSKWKVDAASKAKRERASKVNDREGLLAMIEALEARIVALEARNPI